VKDVAETTGSDAGSDAVLPVDTVEPIDVNRPDTTGPDTVEPADTDDVVDDPGSDTVQTTDAVDATDTVPVPFFAKIAAVAANELINANAANSRFHIIDVRTPGEFNGGHIAGAQNVNVSSSTFSQDIGAFARDGIYLVYCASGNRSAGAITAMKNLDFLTLYELSGGIGSWKNAGYPTTKD
jgi:rhodanese-related sulfurtransferase